MQFSAEDKCPHCGTPYMSMKQPGEPDTRYCYTCETAAGHAEMSAKLQAAAEGNAEDDLALQCPEGDVGAPRPGRMAPGFRRPMNRKPGASKPAIPAVKGSRPAIPAVQAGGSRAAIPAVQAQPTGSRTGIPAVQANPTGSRAVIPAVQPSSTSSRSRIPAVPPPQNPAGGSRAVVPAVKAPAPQKPAIPPPNIEIDDNLIIQMPEEEVAAAPAAEVHAPQSPMDAGPIIVPAAEPRPSGTSGRMQAAPTGSRMNMQAVTPGSRTNLQPATRSSARAPAVTGSAAGITPARRSSVSTPAVRGSAAGIPAAARSGSRQKITVEANPTKKYITFGVAGVVGLVVIIFLFSGKKTPPPETAVASAETKRDEPAKTPPPVVTPVVQTNAAPKAPEPARSESKPEPKAVEKTEVAKIETPATEKPVQTEPVAAEKPAEKESVNDLLAVNNTRKAANAKVDDDEETSAAPKSRSTASKTDAPAAAAQAETKPNGDPKPPADAMIGLGLKKAPVKEAEPDPFTSKPKEIAATAAEPIVVPIDLNKGDQTKEISFSRGLKFPGWRVRDINVENSRTSLTEHRGVKDVLVLNPLNDQLPAKLLATIEIPKDYAGRRPMLRFGVSSKDGTHDWILSAKVLNVEILPKQMIKTKDVNWIDEGIELAGLAGKRFDISIECAMIPKTKQPKFAEQLIYIHDLRLEWSGKQAKPAQK